MYLPPDVKMSGAHKLFITFNIGSEIHAKELNQIIPWYGASIVQDIVFESSLKNIDFIPQVESTKPANEIDLQYDYTLNQDFDFQILKTGVMPPPPVTLTVKPQEKFKLMYNVSYPGNKAGQVLILATVGFESATVNDKPYLLVDVPKSKTAIGEINLVAPKTTGFYEVISYSINSPFEKIDGKSLEDFRTQAAPRFTLEVKD
ncbi:MAG: hypothetical protein C6P35_09970 [Cohnella sp.]|nr:MAG: hypothetical protein C6P35_09970 [Cohnella sp.]